MRCAIIPAVPAAQLERSDAAQLVTKAGRLGALCPVSTSSQTSTWTGCGCARPRRSKGIATDSSFPSSGRRGTRIGLRHPDTGRIVHTPDCPVPAAGLRQALPAILRWLDARGCIPSTFACRTTR